MGGARWLYNDCSVISHFIALSFLAAQVDLPSIEKTLVAELAETRTPGAALVIVRSEEILLSKGFGVASVETREPVTPDHLFRVGSTTKLFTAMALELPTGWVPLMIC